MEKQIGGIIYYVIYDKDNGASYTFYDKDGNVLTNHTVEGLKDAYEYEISGTPLFDKFYVFNNEISPELQWSLEEKTRLLNITTNAIGSGRLNTDLLINLYKEDSTTIWNYINKFNQNKINNCNDWYIGSKAEMNQLLASGKSTWFSHYFLWSSIEFSDDLVFSWNYTEEEGVDWYVEHKYLYGRCFAIRSF